MPGRAGLPSGGDWKQPSAPRQGLRLVPTLSSRCGSALRGRSLPVGGGPASSAGASPCRVLWSLTRSLTRLRTEPARPRGPSAFSPVQLGRPACGDEQGCGVRAGWQVQAWECRRGRRRPPPCRASGPPRPCSCVTLPSPAGVAGGQGGTRHPVERLRDRT